jgi:hypothetical protein
MKGFKYCINGRSYYIKFKYYNNKVVKCYLDDMDMHSTFIGKAKLNIDAGDIYDIEIGEDIALNNALLKREKAYTNFISKLRHDLFHQLSNDEEYLIKKVHKEQSKIKKRSLLEIERTINRLDEIDDQDNINIVKEEEDGSTKI